MVKKSEPVQTLSCTCQKKNVSGFEDKIQSSLKNQIQKKSDYAQTLPCTCPNKDNSGFKNKIESNSKDKIQKKSDYVQTSLPCACRKKDMLRSENKIESNRQQSQLTADDHQRNDYKTVKFGDNNDNTKDFLTEVIDHDPNEINFNRRSRSDDKNNCAKRYNKCMNIIRSKMNEFMKENEDNRSKDEENIFKSINNKIDLLLGRRDTTKFTVDNQNRSYYEADKFGDTNKNTQKVHDNVTNHDPNENDFNRRSKSDATNHFEKGYTKCKCIVRLNTNDFNKGNIDDRIRKDKNYETLYNKGDLPGRRDATKREGNNVEKMDRQQTQFIANNLHTGYSEAVKFGDNNNKTNGNRKDFLDNVTDHARNEIDFNRRSKSDSKNHCEERYVRCMNIIRDKKSEYMKENEDIRRKEEENIFRSINNKINLFLERKNTTKREKNVEDKKESNRQQTQFPADNQHKSYYKTDKLGENNKKTNESSKEIDLNRRSKSDATNHFEKGYTKCKCGIRSKSIDFKKENKDKMIREDGHDFETVKSKDAAKERNKFDEIKSNRQQTQSIGDTQYMSHYETNKFGDDKKTNENTKDLYDNASDHDANEINFNKKSESAAKKKIEKGYSKCKCNMKSKTNDFRKVNKDSIIRENENYYETVNNRVDLLEKRDTTRERNKVDKLESNRQQTHFVAVNQHMSYYDKDKFDESSENIKDSLNDITDNSYEIDFNQRSKRSYTKSCGSRNYRCKIKSCDLGRRGDKKIRNLCKKEFKKIQKEIKRKEKERRKSVKGEMRELKAQWKACCTK